MSGGQPAGGAVASTDALAGPRRVTELGSGWKFRYEAGAQSRELEYDDRDWETVQVPHTWNQSDATSRDYKRGVGWYRLSFKAPAATARQRSYLEFDGANLVATVWLNGQELGTHYGGYSRFRFDVSSALKPGADNLLVVRVDSARREDVPPLQGDFTMFGGLYRHVRLLQTADLGIDVMDYGGPGVYLSSSALSERGLSDSALSPAVELKARVRLSNSGAEPRNARVLLKVLSQEGKVEAETEIEQRAPLGVSVVELSLVLSQVRHWNGRQDPALYNVVTEVYENGQLLDALPQSYGFRSFNVDAERGFFLNGQPYPLYGVGLHQDRAGSGWVVDAAGLQEDFRIIEELGASFVRVVHYQSHPLLYDLCDRYGYVIWAEQALVDKASKGSVFSERVHVQMTELIRQNFNRPSIAFWGVSNEMQTRDNPEARTLVEQLLHLCKREDPARLSTLATNYEEPGGSFGEDVIAHNNYLGWYGGELTDFPKWLDRQRGKAPAFPMGLAEYGAGAGPSIHYDRPAMMDHSEEYQCRYHEACWQAIAERPWLFCSALWNLFDFAAGWRAEGESLGINDKGIVTRDRQVKKDAFYFYKAQWSQRPFVYIASRRFVARTEARTAVTVYSNVREVELLLNGTSLGRKLVEAGKVVWPEVTLRPWGNAIEARSDAQVGAAGGEALVDSVVWILNVFYNPWAKPE